MFEIASKKQILILILLTILNCHNAMSLNIKLTKVLCNVTDETYASVETCRLKAESRDVQYFNIRISFLQLPIEEFRVRLRFMKKANGYKPFLYDLTINCDFINHLNPISKLLWTWTKDVSNLNHSCPLTEDFEIKRLENRYLRKQLRLLPIIKGDYAFIISYASLNVSRFSVEVYASVY